MTMNRYDFVFLFDVKDANPNGDPDAGNLPRVDPETGHGLITDVCLKRKVRNYVAIKCGNKSPHEIYFADGAVLNTTHRRAYDDLGLDPKPKKLPEDDQTARKITAFMCKHFYDIRTFGAVMSTEINCGQVRGPVQLSFARSADPIVSSEHAITRSSVTNEADKEKERTMGRKFTIPYALYRTHGFVNPYLAEQTQFDESDLELLWDSLINAFQFDQSAARPAGSMTPRKLILFKHAKPLGSAPSHVLFDLIQVRRKNAPAREFTDYEISIDRARVGEDVELIEKL